ncbi:MAG TPA: DUF1697 domain-containing protein [Candidatus Koribacter sp.]|jgi:uncharacterized protein (DUF1697 family)
MALVIFLRGVNVGGHRTFRPSVLARELAEYEVTNAGAAGTFVVWKPGTAAKFEAALRKKLAIDCEVIVCEGREVLRIAEENPFRGEARDGVTRFVSVLAKASKGRPQLPMQIPSEGEWLVRLLACDGRFVFGEYRRHMKTIGCLGQIDKVFGGKVTTRNWNTMATIVKILEERKGK